MIRYTVTRERPYLGIDSWIMDARAEYLPRPPGFANVPPNDLGRWQVARPASDGLEAVARDFHKWTESKGWGVSYDDLLRLVTVEAETERPVLGDAPTPKWESVPSQACVYCGESVASCPCPWRGACDGLKPAPEPIVDPAHVQSCPDCGHSPREQRLPNGRVSIACLWCNHGVWGTSKAKAAECWAYFVEGHR